MQLTPLLSAKAKKTLRTPSTEAQRSEVVISLNFLVKCACVNNVYRIPVTNVFRGAVFIVVLRVKNPVTRRMSFWAHLSASLDLG